MAGFPRYDHKSFFCLEALKLPLQSTFLCIRHGRNSKLTVNNVIKVLEEVNWKRLMKTYFVAVTPNSERLRH